MATKKKTKKKQRELKRIAGNRATLGKKASAKKLAKKLPGKSLTPKKKLAKTKVAPKNAALKRILGVPKATGRKTAGATKKRIRGKSESVETVAFAPVGLGARSGGQSGDLQGLSNLEGADSESVDELLEEGNAFEAEVVKGVEDAGDADEREVRTHEVPEDDVPGEYLGKDQ
jgi:hypothetical protein